jgi:sulfite reductase (NADPH) hemoprotein beta-component
MYQYDEFDTQLTRERIGEYRDQVARRVTGDLNEDNFRNLRLRNGLYMQLHAYMLRVAIPYGLMSSDQLRKLAFIARTYDKNYGHFTTRQNLQFNWPKLEDTPEILAHLADVDMSAIQTSGNVNRNVTADAFAGVARDEIEDPRPYCEIVRQFLTLNPEFSWLPRKFKIAVSAAAEDRAAITVHDIGLRLIQSRGGETGFKVLVGGGLGRSPFLGKVIREFLPKDDLISYVQAILRVYNMEGRRDNIFKARIKILVHELGIERFRAKVETEFEASADDPLFIGKAEIARIKAQFAAPPYRALDEYDPGHEAYLRENAAFAEWATHNLAAHKRAGYAIVNLPLKPIGGIPGDVSADQMDLIAGLADTYSFGELRATHRQNLVLADVAKGDLYALWQELSEAGLAQPNLDRITDIICCPGMDYCSLATARSIPVAQRIAERFKDQGRQDLIGELKLNISGCINACGHHHVGHVGLLGVEKQGEEFYQITLGGSAAADADIGKIIGPAFASDDIIDAVETLVDTYLEIRAPGERFLDTYRRTGADPFKERLYAND